LNAKTRNHISGVVFTCFVLASAHAEVVELEGTVKAVDAAARSITIERKAAKGTKTLELEVAKEVGDLSVVKAGNRIAFSYDPTLQVVTKLGLKKPMSCRHLLKVLRRLEEHKGTKPENLPEAVQADHNFLFGYLMGIGDARRGEFTMPTGSENLADLRAKLIAFLEAHPARLDDPACDVVCEVAAVLD